MFTISIDPTDYYTKDNHHNIVNRCQTILNWALNPNFKHSSFKDAVLQQYLYKADFPMGGTIDHNGIYKYPEDPPLHPLLMISRDNDIMYFYEYDIIALKDAKQASGYYITRVD